MMKQTMLQVGSEMTGLDWGQERPVAGPHRAGHAQPWLQRVEGDEGIPGGISWPREAATLR